MNFLLAYLLRSHDRTDAMAGKAKLAKILQQVRGAVDNINRRPAPRSTVLYLMQLRSRQHETSSPAKRRLTISIDLKDGLDIPHPVKITHVGKDSPSNVHTTTR